MNRKLTEKIDRLLLALGGARVVSPGTILPVVPIDYARSEQCTMACADAPQRSGSQPSDCGEALWAT